MTKRTSIFVAAAVAAALTLAGCAAGGPSSSGPDDSLTIAMNSAPVSLDPSKAAVGLGVNFVEPAYASLLNRNADGEIVAGLADEFGYVGDDNMEFHATLRDGVEWADGTPITAQDVVASIQYFAQGSGPSAPYFAGLEVSALDESTIVITSATPNPAIPELLAPENLGGAIISPEGLKDPAKLAEGTYGAGQYIYDAKDSVSGDTYVFTPNVNYYDQSAINYASITIKVISSMSSAVQALKSGQIDFMQGNAEAVASAKGTSSIKVLSSPLTWTGLFLLDRKGGIVPALADERVRQALNYAVDREAIAKALYGEFGQATNQTAIPGFEGYNKDVADEYAYDPKKAKALLAEAGYGDGITIPVNYGGFDPDTTKLVQAIQSQLAEVGVTLELTSASNFGGWVDDLVSGKFAATALPGGAGGGSQFFVAQSTFLPGGIMNVFQAEDPDLTAAFQALASAPEEDRTAAAEKITEISVDHALALPVAASDLVLLYNEKIEGLEFVKLSGTPTYVTQWDSK